MKVISPNEKFVISMTLTGGESNKGVKGYIYDENGVNVTPIPFIPLIHIANGLYMNINDDIYMPLGNYMVQGVVYKDNTYATLSNDYGTAEEVYQVVLTDEEAIRAGLDKINETIKIFKQADMEAEVEEFDEPLEVELDTQDETDVILESDDILEVEVELSENIPDDAIIVEIEELDEINIELGSL